VRYKADTHPEKLDLGVGAYRDENGKPHVLKVVRKVDQQLVESKLDKEYLPIDGSPAFREAAMKLLFGQDCTSLKEKRIASCQGLSGTGSLRLVLELFKMFLDKSTKCYYSSPTWGNHITMFKVCGFSNVVPYRYFDSKTKGVAFKEMMDDLQAAPEKSIVLLQSCAHNPTGADLTKDQWEKLAVLLKAKKHYCLLDSAYQGFATGDIDGDATAARVLENSGLEFAVAMSFAKNMGLYGERIGCAGFVCSTVQAAEHITSQLKAIVRPLYSNPPSHGARIAAAILTDPKLYAEWETEVKEMAHRIKHMRELLFSELKRLNTPGDWSHIVKQIGMFSFTGLTAPQCQHLITKYHVYLLDNGRISIAGLCAKTVPYLAAAMHDAVTNIQ